LICPTLYEFYEFFAYFLKVWTKFVEAAESDEGWDFVEETRCVSIYRRTFDKTGMTCIRGSCILPISANEAAVFATDTSLRVHFDKLFKGGKIIDNLGKHISVVQWEFKVSKQIKLNSSLQNGQLSFLNKILFF
jgi:hypothetical protein